MTLRLKDPVEDGWEYDPWAECDGECHLCSSLMCRRHTNPVLDKLRSGRASDIRPHSCGQTGAKLQKPSWIKRKSPFIIGLATSAVAFWRAFLYYRANDDG